MNFYADWSCQNTLIMQASHPLDFLMSHVFSRRMLNALGAAPLADYALQLISGFFEAGNSVAVHKLVHNFTQAVVED